MLRTLSNPPRSGFSYSQFRKWGFLTRRFLYTFELTRYSNSVIHYSLCFGRNRFSSYIGTITLLLSSTYGMEVGALLTIFSVQFGSMIVIITGKEGVAAGRVLALMNNCIHFLMYSYYALSAGIDHEASSDQHLSKLSFFYLPENSEKKWFRVFAFPGGIRVPRVVSKVISMLQIAEMFSAVAISCIVLCCKVQGRVSKFSFISMSSINSSQIMQHSNENLAFCFTIYLSFAILFSMKAFNIEKVKKKLE